MARPSKPKPNTSHMPRFDPPSIHNFITDSDHFVADAELKVGEQRLPVHRAVLSMISPVFQAMFTHETSEKASGKVKITDFDFDTVKNAMDFCYGCQNNIGGKTVAEILNLLRFADKYDIKTLTKRCEPVLSLQISKSNFCALATYAWEHNSKVLKKKCAEFYKNDTYISLSPKFAKLPMTVVFGIVKAASALNEDESDSYDALSD